jgi:SWIM zinc finger
MEIQSWYPPVIHNSIQDGKRYVIVDGKWTEIPKDLTHNDIKWTKLSDPKVRSKIITNEDKEWSVDGSKGNKYKVSCVHNVWSCTCPAFNYSGNGLTCKHIEKIKLALNS